MIQFSFIIPVYNRPHEIKELLESFKALATSDAFEIVIIEDGSTLCCSDIVAGYQDALDISYYQKPNTGPGDSRNFGMGLAKGNYYIILDSEVNKFGLVRPILNKWHPQGAKITFWLPTLFILFTLASMLFGIIYGWLFLLPLAIYVTVILVDATLKTKSITVGFMAVLAMFIQFFGYGYGFLKATIYIHWLEKDPQKQFPRLFFK